MDFREMNKVKNWPLHAFETFPHKSGNGATLRTSLSGVKKQGDGKDAVYAKSMRVSVICTASTGGEAREYTKENITVSGRFMVDDYVGKDGATHADYKIFADEVVPGRPENASDWTICENWSLRCIEQKAAGNKAELRCRMSGVKKTDRNKQPILNEDGKQTYAKPMMITVIADPDKTKVEMKNFERTDIIVSGKLMVDEEETPDGTVPVYKLFATEIAERQR